MGGIELRDGGLFVERAPNQHDELATAFSRILDRFDIEHVYDAGYVSILTGRARATEVVGVAAVSGVDGREPHSGRHFTVSARNAPHGDRSRDAARSERGVHDAGPLGGFDGQ